MKYLIVPNFYAPKSPAYRGKFGSEKIHAVAYNQCNFRCAFCGFKKLKETNSYQDYSLEAFDQIVERLIPHGRGFKFTGGEPTLNPGLLDSLRCVKKHGGAVLVDTNASNYEMIKQACDEDLIDVLGISLKGLTPEEAMSVSGVSERQLCWDNVLKTIRYAADSANTDVLITYVVDRTTSLSDLDRFFELFRSERSIYFKVNNFQESEFTADTGLRPYAGDLLRKALQSAAARHSELRGRIIFVEGTKGISDSSGVEVI